MRVCFVSHHSCIRVFKQFCALQKRGVEVHNLCYRIANQDLTTFYPSISFYGNDFEYQVKVSHLADVDLIHFHNEPNSLGRIARQNTKFPIIMDCHDLDSVRCGQAYDDEIYCFRNLDGFIFPSKGYMEASIKNYGLDPNYCEVIYSMVNEQLFVTSPLPRLGGIVYEGGTVQDLGTTPDLMGRDYTRLAEILLNQNITFSIFGADHEFPNYYLPRNVVCFQPQHYQFMIRNLSRFDWGLFGNVNPCPQCDNAMPNKIFEYIAAGIPIIVLNAKEAGEWVEENGFGVNLKDPDDIPKIYKDHEKYRRNVLEGRVLYTMESQLDKIIGLYERVMKKWEKRNAGAGDVAGAGFCERGVRICESSECSGDTSTGDSVSSASV